MKLFVEKRIGHANFGKTVIGRENSENKSWEVG
jgi:hypothetical protein